MCTVRPRREFLDGICIAKVRTKVTNLLAIGARSRSFRSNTHGEKPRKNAHPSPLLKFLAGRQRTNNEEYPRLEDGESSSMVIEHCHRNQMPSKLLTGNGGYLGNAKGEMADEGKVDDLLAQY